MLWKSSGVKVILLIFRGRKKMEVLKTGKGGEPGGKGVQILPAIAWVEVVVGSLLCSERFFSGYSGFPLSSKTNISKFQFDQESGRRRTTLWMCYLQIIIYLFIYHLFIYPVDSIIHLSNNWVL